MPEPSIQGRDNQLQIGSQVRAYQEYERWLSLYQNIAQTARSAPVFNYTEIASQYIQQYTEGKKPPRGYDDLVDEQARVIATLQAEIAELKAAIAAKGA